MIQIFKVLKVATRPRIAHPFKDGTGPPPCGFPYHRKSIGHTVCKSRKKCILLYLSSKSVAGVSRHTIGVKRNF